MRDLRADIRSVLVNCAKGRTKIPYGELGEIVDRIARGPWPELQQIFQEEIDQEKPDLTLVVVNKATLLPSIFLDRPLDPSDSKRVALYERRLLELFDFYAAG